MNEEGWAVWFVGLPGCGKTTLAKGVHDYLYVKGMDVVALQMDARRKTYFPDPQYTAQERAKAYGLFVDEAVELVRQGKGVLMDGAACDVSMRTNARERISRFAEVCVHCEIEVAIERESNRPNGAVMAGLYEKALKRQQTGEQFEGLGEVLGIDVEFGIDPDAELILDNTHLSKEETLRKVLHFLDSWLGSV
ncbi:MAG: adenylyl-sulfate kinase [Pseudodesulfovibrio sp.]|nr:adenylyl-sulfate kinase [Pseudodesulfovibrio sp.]